MNIIVVGAGIIGMTTAYYLRRDGHSVTVIDEAAAPGSGTSQANGSQLSYSFVAPLADPAVIRKLPGLLRDSDSPLTFRLRADLAQWRWGIAFLLACRARTHQRTSAELLRLGALSRELVHQLVSDEAVDFDFKTSGKLLVYEDATAFSAARQQMGYQAALGCRQTVLNAAECVAQEPALSDIAERIVGGIFTPTEDAGDCRKLCVELARILVDGANAVRFLFNTRVVSIRKQGACIAALRTDAGDLQADAYVLANGLGVQALGRTIGLDAQIYPLKGYSLTYTLTPQSIAPLTSVSDIRNKVVYARLGNRLRVAGMVEIGVSDTQIDPKKIASLSHDVAHYLPRLNAAGAPKVWSGLRPARPNGKPVIGATPYRNLWINAGHGGLGFTLAAASAHLLVDQIAGRQSVIEKEVFAL